MSKQRITKREMARAYQLKRIGLTWPEVAKSMGITYERARLAYRHAERRQECQTKFNG